jgi:hypothetical protein
VPPPWPSTESPRCERRGGAVPAATSLVAPGAADGMPTPCPHERGNSPAGLASPIAGCRGPAARLVVVLTCSRRFVPGQAAVVAAVRRRVPRGQGALAFVELPGRGGPAAGHSPIQHPIGRKSTSQSELFMGRLCTAGPPTKNLPLLSCQPDRATGGTWSASGQARPAPKPCMASLRAAPEPAGSDVRDRNPTVRCA